MNSRPEQDPTAVVDSLKRSWLKTAQVAAQAPQKASYWVRSTGSKTWTRLSLPKKEEVQRLWNRLTRVSQRIEALHGGRKA